MAHVRKLRLDGRIVSNTHYGGWRYAVQQLEPLCRDDGVHVDTFLEWTFAVDLEQSLRDHLIPYKEPWIGFLHNPVGIPAWHEPWSAPPALLEQPHLRSSLGSCRGIVTLSRHFAEWLAARVELPVLALVHPTNPPGATFSLERFLAARPRRVVQVGVWLRRLTSIARLPVRSVQRAILTPMPDGALRPFRDAVQRDLRAHGASMDLFEGVARIPYQTNQGYDELLAESLVFLHLYDAVANNTLVECIVRNTPVLVNALPSVVEYLGPAYPFYFESLDEAARKADDVGCVRAAWHYLQELPKQRFSGEAFREDLARSPLYRDL